MRVRIILLIDFLDKIIIFSTLKLINETSEKRFVLISNLQGRALLEITRYFFFFIVLFGKGVFSRSRRSFTLAVQSPLPHHLLILLEPDHEL